MNKEELIKLVDKFRKSGLSNGTALGHHSGINDEIADMLEKQVPKKPDIYGDGYDDNGNLNYDTYDCPNCNASYEIDYEKYDYCPSCGQKLDWSEENEID